METRDIDKTYQRIGEYVVSFQWLENRIREIGWLIQDPDRRNWPPQTLRDESNHQLIKAVERRYLNLIGSLRIDDEEERKRDFSDLMTECHQIRRYRNNLLHSAFIELKAGGEVRGLLRSNPELKIDDETGDLLFDHEVLSEDSIINDIDRIGHVGFQVNMHYLQLIQWAPFDHLRK